MEPYIYNSLKVECHWNQKREILELYIIRNEDDLPRRIIKLIIIDEFKLDGVDFNIDDLRIIDNMKYNYRESCVNPNTHESIELLVKCFWVEEENKLYINPIIDTENLKDKTLKTLVLIDFNERTGISLSWEDIVINGKRDSIHLVN